MSRSRLLISRFSPYFKNSNLEGKLWHRLNIYFPNQISSLEENDPSRGLDKISAARHFSRF